MTLWVPLAIGVALPFSLALALVLVLKYYDRNRR